MQLKSVTREVKTNNALKAMYNKYEMLTIREVKTNNDKTVMQNNKTSKRTTL